MRQQNSATVGPARDFSRSHEVSWPVRAGTVAA
jgi:hypothetical protein